MIRWCVCESEATLKTPLDISELARELQRRADREGRTPEAVIADVLAAGLPPTAAEPGGSCPSIFRSSRPVLRFPPT
jgi:hypothetical protein